MSATILEEKLNREVLCLCWPGGSATKEGMKIARNIGYQLFTIGNDMSKKEKIKYGNVVGSPGRIKRYTPIWNVSNGGKNNKLLCITS